AQVVVGHHPHVPQRIERYRGGVIAYSLGNFLFDMRWSSDVRTGTVLRVELDGREVRHSAISVAVDDDCGPRLASQSGALPRYVATLASKESLGPAEYRRAY